MCVCVCGWGHKSPQQLVQWKTVKCRELVVKCWQSRKAKRTGESSQKSNRDNLSLLPTHSRSTPLRQRSSQTPGVVSPGGAQMLSSDEKLQKAERGQKLGAGRGRDDPAVMTSQIFC